MSEKSNAQASVLQGHRGRLKAKLEQDPVSLSDAEIMELLLALVIPRRDTKVLARELLAQFEGFRGALDARRDELLALPGFGPGSFTLWVLIREVLARYAASSARARLRITDPASVAFFAQRRLGHLPGEECWAALLDAQNHLIAWERLRTGSVSSVAIEPRDVLELALLRKACGIILVHNHPGGSPRPSQQDLALTRQLEELAPHLGLRLLDHVIVTSGDCYSISMGTILHAKE